MTFVGPTPELLELLGDKTAARRLAASAGVPVLPGAEKPVSSPAEARKIASEIGYPVIVKAAMGGGGRGMRVVYDAEQFGCPRAGSAERGQVRVRRCRGLPRKIPAARQAHRSANSCAMNTATCCIFTNAIAPCSGATKKLWKSHRPATSPEKIRAELCEAAVRIARKARYRNAGTVEFLYDVDSQQLVLHRSESAHSGGAHRHGSGHRYGHRALANSCRRKATSCTKPPLSLRAGKDSAVRLRAAVPRHHRGSGKKFRARLRQVTTYRSPAGFGIRLDGGTAYSGALLAAVLRFVAR